MLMLIATFLLVIATFLLVIATLRLWKATKLLPVTSMTVAFQDEWHSIIARKMRGFLHSVEFEQEFRLATKEVYGKKIGYEELDMLLSRNELPNNEKDDKMRLENFRDYLDMIPYCDPIRPDKPLFSALDAVEHTLLTCDRLAILQDKPEMRKAFIEKYEPAMQDLAPKLQGYIAVRRLLKEQDKPFKKDFMLLLNTLGLAHKSLFKKCVSSGSKRQTKRSKILERRLTIGRLSCYIECQKL